MAIDPNIGTEDQLRTLSLEELRELAQYRAVEVDTANMKKPEAKARIIAALLRLPPSRPIKGKLAGKRVVRTSDWQEGKNPRRAGAHGWSAFNLIPNGPLGIRVEDLLARIDELPAKSSEKYGAGGTNHIYWDLNRGYTKLVDDPGFDVSVPHTPHPSDVRSQAVDLQENETQRVATVVERIVRNSGIVAKLKQMYGNRCQICEVPLCSDSGWTYSEGHHLRPLGGKHGGPDTVSNIVILCPNHHALCDFGQLRIEMDSLLLLDEHPLDVQYVGYHNEVVCTGLE